LKHLALDDAVKTLPGQAGFRGHVTAPSVATLAKSNGLCGMLRLLSGLMTAFGKSHQFKPALKAIHQKRVFAVFATKPTP
jgi:hypothetical protein